MNDADRRARIAFLTRVLHLTGLQVHWEVRHGESPVWIRAQSIRFLAYEHSLFHANGGRHT